MKWEEAKAGSKAPASAPAAKRNVRPEEEMTYLIVLVLIIIVVAIYMKSVSSSGPRPPQTTTAMPRSASREEETDLYPMKSGGFGDKFQKSTEAYFEYSTGQEQAARDKDWNRYVELAVKGIYELPKFEKAELGQWKKIAVGTVLCLEVFDYLCALKQYDKARELYALVKANAKAIFKKFLAPEPSIDERIDTFKAIYAYIAENPGSIQSELGKALGIEGAKDYLHLMAKLGTVRREKFKRSYKVYTV